MEKMSTLLSSLNSALKTNSTNNIVSSLKKILSQEGCIHVNDGNTLQTLLEYKNHDVHKLSVRLLAELAKKEENRSILAKQEIINLLLCDIDKSEDVELVTDAFRALGNICYENTAATKMMGKRALETVLLVLNGGHKVGIHQSTDLNGSGFLLNLLNSDEELQKVSLKCGVLDIISVLFGRYLNDYSKCESMFYFLLSILNVLIDYMEDQNVAFTVNLCLQVVKIFKLPCDKPDVSVLCLEILHSQSEKDEIKIILAKEGVCELVIGLIEKYKSQVNDEETRSVMKMACDMLVIVLTGDDCMNLLYEQGNGKVYKHMLAWLDSDDVDLLSTGVLALGNFARKDTHCIQMVKNGVSKKLIEILSGHNKREDDMKVQHALLSTLKNLVIPQQNKHQVLEEGLVDVIYPMTQLDQYMVVFKLLGTFRMVIDNQEKAALDLINRKEFLERLVYWCYNSDHLGVRGEVPRLLAWLIKYCHSFKPFHDFLQVDNAVKCIVEMISSNHAVMQNEAFYALNLLCVGCPLTTADSDHNSVNSVHPDGEVSSDQQLLYEILIAADVGKHLNFMLNKYSDKMEKHILENLVSLLEQLVTCEKIVKHLKDLNVEEGLAKILHNPNTGNIKDRIQKVIAEISH